MTTRTVPQVANLSVETVDVNSLHEHPDNPRRGDLGALGESLEASRVLRSDRGPAFIGHDPRRAHRWREARAKGMTELPVAWLDVDRRRGPSHHVGGQPFVGPGVLRRSGVDRPCSKIWPRAQRGCSARFMIAPEEVEWDDLGYGELDRVGPAAEHRALHCHDTRSNTIDEVSRVIEALADRSSARSRYVMPLIDKR